MLCLPSETDSLLFKAGSRCRTRVYKKYGLASLARRDKPRGRLQSAPTDNTGSLSAKSEGPELQPIVKRLCAVSCHVCTSFCGNGKSHGLRIPRHLLFAFSFQTTESDEADHVIIARTRGDDGERFLFFPCAPVSNSQCQVGCLGPNVNSGGAFGGRFPCFRFLMPDNGWGVRGWA
jgi:hypothetical protein